MAYDGLTDFEMNYKRNLANRYNGHELQSHTQKHNVQFPQQPAQTHVQTHGRAHVQTHGHAHGYTHGYGQTIYAQAQQARAKLEKYQETFNKITKYINTIEKSIKTDETIDGSTIENITECLNSILSTHNNSINQWYDDNYHNSVQLLLKTIGDHDKRLESFHADLDLEFEPYESYYGFGANTDADSDTDTDPGTGTKTYIRV